MHAHMHITRISSMICAAQNENELQIWQHPPVSAYIYIPYIYNPLAAPYSFFSI